MNETPRLYDSPCSVYFHTNLQKEAVSVELVRWTLNFSYCVLQDATDVSNGLAASMFGLSLQTYSREQLLSKLVWSMGSGSSVLKDFAVTDPGALLKTKSSDFLAVEFNTVNPRNEAPLINADDIVKWMVSIGVRRISEDILEVPMSNQAKLDGINSAPGYSKGQYSFLKADLFFSPTQSKIATDNPEMPTISRVGSILISQSILFRNLSNAGVCLSSGIAYRRQHLAKIVMASRVP
jgi:hypothetical protein